MTTADIVLWLGDEAPPVPALWIHARSDLAGRGVMPPECAVAISAASGIGITALWAVIAACAATLLPPPDGVALNQRQRGLIAEAQNWLAQAGSQTDVVLIAEHLRLALGALHRLTGRSDVEAMLDALFARFCIGK